MGPKCKQEEISEERDSSVDFRHFDIACFISAVLTVSTGFDKRILN